MKLINKILEFFGYRLFTISEVDTIHHSLLYATSYISYIKERDESLHNEADGIPSFTDSVDNSLATLVKYDK